MRVEGMDEIIAKLRQIARTTRPKVVNDALRAGGEVIAEEARRIVPVRTGRLRDSIVVRVQKMGEPAVGLSVNRIQAYIGPRYGAGFYGHMVEFGTFRASPRPFMRPAFDSKSAEAASVVIERLRIEFERLAKD